MTAKPVFTAGQLVLVSSMHGRRRSRRSAVVISVHEHAVRVRLERQDGEGWNKSTTFWPIREVEPIP